MTTMIFLLWSIVGLACSRAQPEGDDRVVLVHRRSERFAHRRLAMRGRRPDEVLASVVVVFERLLPHNVVDAARDKRRSIGEMHSVAEAERRLVRHLVESCQEVE